MQQDGGNGHLIIASTTLFFHQCGGTFEVVNDAIEKKAVRGNPFLLPCRISTNMSKLTRCQSRDSQLEPNGKVVEGTYFPAPPDPD